MIFLSNVRKQKKVNTHRKIKLTHKKVHPLHDQRLQEHSVGAQAHLVADGAESPSARPVEGEAKRRRASRQMGSREGTGAGKGSGG